MIIIPIAELRSDVSFGADGSREGMYLRQVWIMFFDATGDDRSSRMARLTKEAAVAAVALEAIRERKGYLAEKY